RINCEEKIDKQFATKTYRRWNRLFRKQNIAHLFKRGGIS
uniref:HTH_48 domain-containing protein n=1 Tax=Ascaris lumbricoides TaxID=6252 RepID=A0A0M3HLW4_ASCLU